MPLQQQKIISMNWLIEQISLKALFLLMTEFANSVIKYKTTGLEVPRGFQGPHVKAAGV